MSGRPAPSLALLSAVTALAFCGLHMVVPVLPLLVAVFADTPAHVQLVVSLYLAGIGAGQLVYGPVSDRFGRRRCCSPVSRHFSSARHCAAPRGRCRR
jgi:DHA1 family bicyclomycin/chloramphenicol resistance-like MFS transporter